MQTGGGKNGDDKNKKLITTRRIGESAAGEVKAVKRSVKKVLYIEIDDEVTAIFDRLKQLKMKNVYLVVPKRAMLFQSIVNLKILKRKAEDLEKNIYIITNDQNGLHLAKQIGLIVYDKLEGHDHPSLVSGKFLEDQQSISPLKASTNEPDDDLPTRQTEKKLSISEIVRKGKGKGLAFLARSMPFKSGKAKDLKKNAGPREKLVFVAPNRQALISLVVVSLIILLTITYIALPGATLKLTPKSNVITTSANITLADADLNQAEFDLHPQLMIPSYSVTALIKRPLTYAATGKELGDTSQNAKGLITIINTSNKDWALLAKTRFQTQNNLIFRSANFVTVPAQNGDKPGTIDIAVEADSLDGFQQVIGERGNIGPSKFILPGLSAENQKKLFAESHGAMSGGKTVVIKKILKEDLNAAGKKIADDLKNSAQVELQAKITEENLKNKTDLILLLGDRAIQSGNAKIMIPPNLEGQKLDSFDVQGEVTTSGVAYSRSEMINVLKTKLSQDKNPQKRLTHIDEDSLTYRIIDVNANTHKIVITATIKGIEEFEIRPGEENGDRLIKKIKEHVVGKDIREARDYIQNLPEIDKVKIESWPAWAPTMPSVPDNIKVELAGG